MDYSTPPYLVAWMPDEYRTLWSLFNLEEGVLCEIERINNEPHHGNVYVCGPWGVLPAEKAVAKLKERFSVGQRAKVDEGEYGTIVAVDGREVRVKLDSGGTGLFDDDALEHVEEASHG